MPGIEKVVLKSFPQPSWKKLAEGGEATIYLTPEGRAIKVYRHWKDGFYLNDQDQMNAAMARFEEIQQKLIAMPKMPKGVVVPQRLLTTAKGSIFGYEMEYICGAKPLTSMWDSADIREKRTALAALRDLVEKNHECGIVIGDFVPRDVLWKRETGSVYLLDSDSMQFSGFECKTFTIEYADPKNLGFVRKNGSHETKIILKKTFDELSDWYSFYGICLNVFTGVEPFGGFNENAKGIEQRVKDNITVFNPDVSYPVTAYPLSIIGRDLLGYMLVNFRYGKTVKPLKKLFYE